MGHPARGQQQPGLVVQQHQLPPHGPHARPVLQVQPQFQKLKMQLHHLESDRKLLLIILMFYLMTRL